jgi:hypothetical protein
VVADVDGDKITRAELSHWSAVGPSHAAVARARILSLLIRANWLLDEARKLAISVSASEVRHEVAELVADRAENFTYPALPRERLLREWLLAPGLRRKDQEWLMRLTLLTPRVEKARLGLARRNVPRALIERFYTEHRHLFFIPDQRQVEIIGGSEADVLQAKHEIERGRPFLAAAQKSLDPEAPGGLWRLVRGHDEPQVEGPVFAARAHVLVGPKHYSQYYIFEVLEAIPAHQQTLAAVEGKIRQTLAPTTSQLARAFERTRVTRTTCHAGYAVRECAKHQG